MSHDFYTCFIVIIFYSNIGFLLKKNNLFISKAKRFSICWLILPMTTGPGQSQEPRILSLQCDWQGPKDLERLPLSSQVLQLGIEPAPMWAAIVKGGGSARFATMLASTDVLFVPLKSVKFWSDYCKYYIQIKRVGQDFSQLCPLILLLFTLFQLHLLIRFYSSLISLNFACII